MSTYNNDEFEYTYLLYKYVAFYTMCITCLFVQLLYNNILNNTIIIIDVHIISMVSSHIKSYRYICGDQNNFRTGQDS